MSKKAPSPRLKLNPFVGVDMSLGKFIMSDADMETIEKIDSMLSHTMIDDNILANESIEEVEL